MLLLDQRRRKTLLRMIGDIALWNTTRASNKAFFPVSFFLTVAATNPNHKRFFDIDVCPNTAIQVNMIPASIQTIDFSGVGAYRFWNDVSVPTFKIRRSTSMTGDTAKEFVFHSVWGSAKEDLGLLEWMTGVKFQNRRQMGKQFQGRGEGTTGQPFLMIKFRRICKLANASQTDFLSGGKGQVSSAPTFSGSCTQRVSIESELFKTLTEGSTESSEGRQDINKVLARLARVKEGVVRFGTTDFFVPSDYTSYGVRETDATTLSGRFFFGSED